MSNPYDQVIRTYRDEDEGLSDVYLMATQEDAIRLADDIREDYRRTKYGNHCRVSQVFVTAEPQWIVVHDLMGHRVDQIIQTRKARETGAIVSIARVQSTRSPYMVICRTHGCQTHEPRRDFAQWEASHPSAWCCGCWHEADKRGAA